MNIPANISLTFGLLDDLFFLLSAWLMHVLFSLQRETTGAVKKNILVDMLAEQGRTVNRFKTI